MEGNVTMDKPCSWVVGFVRDHDVAVARHKNYVSSRGVVELQGQGAGAEIFVVCLFKQCEVVSMQVYLPRWVRAHGLGGCSVCNLTG